ncbi:MAG: hypothetical protein DRG78_06565 [Epsilonproteobacteria bacterium]|nr:MAG: hypothetical protein DRG78_06565 [Campylobacterota bacterium]
MKSVNKQPVLVVTSRTKKTIASNSISYNDIIKTARAYSEGGKIKIDYRLFEKYRLINQDRHRLSTGLPDTPRNLQRIKRDVYLMALNHYLEHIKQSDVDEITLGDIALEAIRENKEARTEDTQNSYEKDYFNKIENIFADMPLVDIKVKHLNTWKKNLLEDNPMTKSRFVKYKRILNFIFDYAMREEIIEKNPVSLINMKIGFKPPKDQSKMYFTKDEVKLMLDNTSGFDHAYLTTLFFSGMRIGEVLALKWTDINFEKSTLLIQRSTRKRKFKLTKTKIKNEIIMAKPFKDVLEQYKSIAPQCDLVFPNAKTLCPYYESTSLVKRVFKPLLKKLDIPYRPLRYSRSTFASLMVDAQIPITTVQKFLGHSSLNTTLKFYTKNGLLKMEADERIDNLYVS